MPFFRNGINRLYFRKKSESPKSQQLYSLSESTTMCYTIVTKLLYLLLVFAKKGISHEFQGVRHCKSGKQRYIFVTLLVCLKRSDGQKKERFPVLDQPLFRRDIIFPHPCH
jgi:hypothetical protein